MLFPAVIFFLFALSVAGFAIAQLVVSGIPQAPAAGSVEAVTADQLPTYSSLTATFDRAERRVSYSFYACYRAAPTFGGSFAPARPFEAILLLFGNARVAPGSTGTSSSATAQPLALGGQGIGALTFGARGPSAERKLPSDVEAF